MKVKLGQGPSALSNTMLSSFHVCSLLGLFFFNLMVNGKNGKWKLNNWIVILSERTNGRELWVKKDIV